jgi:UDP-N-acetylglucosamine/UDP-N-acetylgalactosamine diphosphorylase
MHHALEEQRQRFGAAGQEHVFRFAEDLSDAEQQRFAQELAAVDLDWVAARHAQYEVEKDGETKTPLLEPAPVIELPGDEEAKAKEAAAREAGEAALRAGRMAAFLVAGGQGTRLGFDGPKGCYPIGPITERTLFQWHAEQIRARAGRYGTTIPWYIMTSTANDAATRAAFEENEYFGFDPEDVMFFTQKMVPAMDFAGKLLLDGKGSLALNPNGHGGSLAALHDSGATADMKRRGIDTISYFQVDNPLVTICDPVFAGHHLQAGAQMSSKVLEKNAPEEKVGVICRIDGTLGVIEYSDLDEKNMHAEGADGRLKYWAGSIAIHMLDVGFVDRVAGEGLPWHVAIKKIPCLGEAGEPCKPEEPNGVKFETFVFDALPLADASVTMEVRREEEFAPVKNATGIDSARSARQLLSDYAARRLTAAGVEVATDADGRAAVPIEMPYLYALDAEDISAKIEPGMRIDKPTVLE